MNDQEPEWASNIKRGLATYLQMNMERVTPQKLMFFKDEEVFYVWHCFASFLLNITFDNITSENWQVLNKINYFAYFTNDPVNNNGSLPNNV